MADCVSPLNAAEFLNEMKWYIDNPHDCDAINMAGIVAEAADAIEQLVQENAKLIEKYNGALEQANAAARAYDRTMEEIQKLKAERDAAVADINDISKRYGAYCRYCKTDCAFKLSNGWCSGCRKFEWRGVQPDETCTSCSLDDLWEQIEKKNGGC